MPRWRARRGCASCFDDPHRCEGVAGPSARALYRPSWSPHHALGHAGGEPRAFVQAALQALGQFVAAGRQEPDAAAAMRFRRLYWQACMAARAAAGRSAPAPLLTRREDDVMQWLACGKTDAEIGALLAISPRTVHKHLQHVYEKLGVETRTAAVMALQRRAAT